MLLSINPKVDFDYVYNVPDDQPAGTFWYHPHKHGSSAIQVGSGMAGVLLTKGERPQATAMAIWICCYAHLSRRKATNT